MHDRLRMHGSCVSRNGAAVLAVGPPGCGKSDLVLRLLARGFELVADDLVDIAGGIACCPAELAGLLEVRGLGIMRLPYRTDAPVALVIELDGRAERLPWPRWHPELDVPVVRIDAAGRLGA